MRSGTTNIDVSIGVSRGMFAHEWLRDMVSAIFALSLCLHGLTAQAAKQAKFKGEYILSRNQLHNPVCQAFTRNLNQFRRLDFNECHPRLSTKFPELSRPTWEEIPFSPEMAEQVIKGTYRSRYQSPVQDARAEEHWRNWLRQSETIRKSGQAHMWRTRIDLDGDGREETIIRMVPDIGVHPLQLATRAPWACGYNLGILHMTGNVNSEVEDAFNHSGGADIIYFARDGRYYRADWNSAGPAYGDIDIGATSGVTLSRLNWNGHLVTGGDECLIDWVPTGRYKPLTRHRY